MRARYLFPYKSRFIGLLLILVHIPVMMIWENKSHLSFIVTSLLVLVGLFLIAFSKEKIEDEQIDQLRLDSLRWAIYCNYLILILIIIFTNGTDFIDMLRLNLWIPLVFFIIRFRWVIMRLNRSLN